MLHIYILYVASLTRRDGERSTYLFRYTGRSDFRAIQLAISTSPTFNLLNTLLWRQNTDIDNRQAEISRTSHGRLVKMWFQSKKEIIHSAKARTNVHETSKKFNHEIDLDGSTWQKSQSLNKMETKESWLISIYIVNVLPCLYANMSVASAHMCM